MEIGQIKCRRMRRPLTGEGKSIGNRFVTHTHTQTQDHKVALRPFKEYVSPFAHCRKITARDLQVVRIHLLLHRLQSEKVICPFAIHESICVIRIDVAHSSIPVRARPPFFSENKYARKIAALFGCRRFERKFIRNSRKTYTLPPSQQHQQNTKTFSLPKKSTAHGYSQHFRCAKKSSDPQNTLSTAE